MIEKFRLSNGLKVLLIENHKAPVITIQSWVRTGSADEQKDQEGLSHFIEHLLFKGTEKFKVGEIAQLIEGAGGDLNAYTSFDQTVFYMTLSSQFVDLGLDAMSEMMGKPLFDKQEVDNEREVVIEEIKRSNDSPARVSSQNLFSTVYEKHPYGRPVIGYDKVVKNTPVEKIKKLYFERYCPENMFLIVVGDFTASEMKKKVTKQFSILKGKLKKVKREKDPLQKEMKFKALKTNFNDCFLNIAFKTPTQDIDDIATLDLLSYILSFGDSTRLAQSLRLEEHLVNELGVYQFDSKDPGFFTTTLYFSPEKTTGVLDVFSSELMRLFTENITTQEIEKALNQILSTEFYQETMDSLARRVGNDEFMYQDPQFYKKYIKIISSKTPEDIRKVVLKYFKKEFLNISFVYPEAKSGLEKELKAWANEFGSALELMREVEKKKSETKTIKKLNFSKDKKSFTEELIKEQELPNGGRLIIRPIRDTRVVSARVAFLGGLRSDPLEKPGINEMISRLWLSGTHNKSELEISEELERSASYLSPFSGRNSLGLHLQTLDINEKAMSNLMSDVILNSQFPEKEFSREKNVLFNYFKSIQDHPSTLVFLDFMRSLFKGHPYQSETFGNEESLKQINNKDVLNLYSKIVVAKNMTIVIAGGIDASFWKDWSNRLSSQMKKGESFSKVFPHDSITQEIKTYKALKKEQSHILYGYKGIRLDEEVRHTMQVMQTILSGQGGRLFMNLRDRASLAYSVSPVRMDGLDTGYFGAYIGCSPEKGTKAIEMMKSEFDRLMNEKVSDFELDRAKTNIIGKHDISLQKTTNLSQSIMFDEIYNVKYLEPKEFAEKIKAVKSQDIQSLAHRLFTQKRVISCVGSICPW